MRVSRALFDGRRLNLAFVQEIEATYRNEAEQVLAAFAAEAAPLSAEHWVQDDLSQDWAEISTPRRLLSQAERFATEGNLPGAYLLLSLNLYDYRLWMTADERGECAALMCEIVQRLPELEKARQVIQVLAVIRC